MQTEQDTRLSDAFFTARIFARWRYRTDQEQLLSGQIAVWEATKRKRLLVETVDRWAHAAILSRAERIVTDRRDQGAVREIFVKWLARTKQERQARRKDESRVLRSAMGSWKFRLGHVKVSQMTSRISQPEIMC